MQDIFVFRKRGRSDNGEVLGEFVSTGIRPHCVAQLAAAGVAMSADAFAGMGVVG
jgi:pilus assembly protein CpaF